MPPPAVGIPVVNRTNTPYNGRGKWPPGRKYSDQPLPTKLSDYAPRNARIAGRVADTNGVIYTLKIGEVELTDIGVDEILDYVSPLYLEQYENGQFAEERDVLAALEEERQEHKMEKLERQKERAKMKGNVLSGELDSADDAMGAEGGDPVRNGRARPTYTHLFNKLRGRKRRKRDPQTGELIPLSDEDESDGKESMSSDGIGQQSRATIPSARSFVELPPKGRRRKRDKLTGKLLPLSPIVQQTAAALEKKRRRRRRHPVTGELMPIGWNYDPENDENDDGDINASQSLRNLSLVHEHEAKRPRLTSENPISSSSSSSPSPSFTPPRAERGLIGSPMSAYKLDRRAVVDLSTPNRRKLDVPPLKHGSPQGKATLPLATVIPNESVEDSSLSPDPELRTSITRPTAKWQASISPALQNRQLPQPKLHSVKGVTTSLLNPSAAHASSSSAPISDGDINAEEEEDDDDDDDDDEWEVDEIIDHRYSNPETHPPGQGSAPVLLYRTKWVGSSELTWEPSVSFGDWEVVREYRRNVGLPSEPSDAEIEDDEYPQTPLSPPSSRAPARVLARETRDPILATGETDDSGSESGSDEVMDEDQFEFEAILSHHLSDPRTHPPQLGKTPVMLYQVKWKGWEEPTWEPAGSFEDPKMLEEYRRRVGLKSANLNRGER